MVYYCIKCLFTKYRKSSWKGICFHHEIRLSHWILFFVSVDMWLCCWGSVLPVRDYGLFVVTQKKGWWCHICINTVRWKKVSASVLGTASQPALFSLHSALNTLQSADSSSPWLETINIFNPWHVSVHPFCLQAEDQPHLWTKPLKTSFCEREF